MPDPRPDHYAGTTLTHEAERGQVWASTHSGDVREGKRQRRLVTEVEKDYAWLQTAGREGLDGSTRVKLRNGKIKGHRLVESAPPPLAHEKRCPTCGSDNPLYMRCSECGKVWLPDLVRPNLHRCPDPFHKPQKVVR